MSDTVTERVALGAKHLDETLPDWAENINLHRLTFTSSEHDILGQCFGNHVEGKRKLKLLNFQGLRNTGFLAHRDEDLEYCAAWEAEITKRQTALCA